MADPYDIFTEGVPNTRTGAPSVFGDRGVDIYQAQSLSRSRLANEVLLADTRDKLNTYRDREATRVQGKQVMEVLPKLDPRSPDYRMQVKDVLAKNPNAMLDKTVVTFLDVQGDIFDQFEAERQDKQQLDRRLELERAGHDLMLEREKTRLKDAGAIQRDMAVEEKLSSLPASQLAEFNDLREFGLDPATAIKRVEEKAINEAAIDELYKMGLTDSDIMGDPDVEGKPISKEGVLDKDGKVNPRKYAKLIGEVNRKKSEQAAKEDEVRKYEAQLELLQDSLKAQGVAGDATVVATLNKNIDLLTGKIQTLRGVDLPDPTQTPAPAAPGTTPSPAPQHPDLDETDRYIPKR